MKLFHATYGQYLDSIMKNGLIPNFHDNWKMGIEIGLYLSNNMSFCVSLAESAKVDEELLDDIVVLEVEIPQPELLKNDPHMNFTDNPENIICYSYPKSIEEKYLRIV